MTSGNEVKSGCNLLHCCTTISPTRGRVPYRERVLSIVLSVEVTPQRDGVEATARAPCASRTMDGNKAGDRSEGSPSAGYMPPERANEIRSLNGRKGSVSNIRSKFTGTSLIQTEDSVQSKIRASMANPARSPTLSSDTGHGLGSSLSYERKRILMNDWAASLASGGMHTTYSIRHTTYDTRLCLSLRLKQPYITDSPCAYDI
jgi:hypothetical protein